LLEGPLIVSFAAYLLEVQKTGVRHRAAIKEEAALGIVANGFAEAIERDGDFKAS